LKSGRFKIYWLNIKTNEKKEYNLDEDNSKLEPYRSLVDVTDWRLFIERYQGDFFKNKYDEWNVI